MEEITHKKREIGDKLQQDEAKLSDLKANLEKSQQLTHNMVKILDSFTVRLKKLDDTVAPVYTRTQGLTRLQENVEKTLIWMDRVIGFHHVADEVEPRIREGPGASVEAYLKLLDRLRVAWDFFTHNNPGSVELSHVNELFDCGLDALQKEFLQLLKKHSKPVPVAILNDIATCEDMEDLPPLDHLPAKVVMDLKSIAQYLISAPGESHTDVMSVYAQIRSNQLGRSLNSLKETSQSSSLLPTSIPRKSSFAVAFRKGHGQSPSKRPTKRGADPTGSLRRGTSASQIGHSGSFIGDPLEEQLEGCSSFLASSTIFLRLIQSEVRLMEQIIPPQHHQHVLDNLTRQPIEFFMRDGETLFQQARRSITRHDFPIVISCFRLIRHIQMLLPEYKAVLANIESRPFDRFPHLLQQFENLNMKALEDYIQYTREDPDKQSNLPKDGTVHELTSSTMWFLEQLLEFSRILGEVSLGQSSYAVRSTEVERHKAVGLYMKRVLDSLGLNLENKARSYESPFLGAIFLMNNYHFIHKAFTGNDLMLRLLENVFENAEDHYSNLISQHGRNYQRGFSKLIGFLGQEVSMAASNAETKLSKQSKQLLKDKFKGFNTELEELHKVQQHWSIPDPQLRNRIREDNVEMVAQLYTEFYRVYAKRNFTKNPDKYLKYSPNDLERTLQSFFDGGV